MKFVDLIIEYPNILDADLCDTIIDRFESDSRKTQGVTSGGAKPDVKVSSDLNLSAFSDWSDIDSILYEKLTPYAAKYVNYLDEHLMSGLYGVFDTGYQIQKTSPGGFYKWHNDSGVKYPTGTELTHLNTRFATYIFYLNDIGDNVGGKTKFYFNGEYSITPQRGKLIMFPASTLYTHCGEEFRGDSKYIITGWLYSPIRNLVP